MPYISNVCIPPTTHTHTTTTNWCLLCNTFLSTVSDAPRGFKCCSCHRKCTTQDSEICMHTEKDSFTLQKQVVCNCHRGERVQCRIHQACGSAIQLVDGTMVWSCSGKCFHLGRGLLACDASTKLYSSRLGSNMLAERISKLNRRDITNTGLTAPRAIHCECCRISQGWLSRNIMHSILQQGSACNAAELLHELRLSLQHRIKGQSNQRGLSYRNFDDTMEPLRAKEYPPMRIQRKQTLP